MLQDKVIIVTGAGRGLGQAYAVEAARLGAKVVAGDIIDCSDTKTNGTARWTSTSKESGIAAKQWFRT